MLSVFIVVAAALAIAAATLWPPLAITIALPERDVRQALDARFPHSQRHALVFDLAFSNPRLLGALADLGNGESDLDRVGLAVDVAAGLVGDAAMGTGTAELSARLRWDGASASFRIDDLRVERLQLAGLPEARVKPVTDAVAEVLPARLAGTVVHVVGDGAVARRAAGLVVRAVSAREGALHVALQP